MGQFSFQRLDEKAVTAISLYGEICASEEVMMFLESIYSQLHELTGLVPSVDLDNLYVDSPTYQRQLITQSIAILLSLDDVQIHLVNQQLEEMVSALREIHKDDPQYVDADQDIIPPYEDQGEGDMLSDEIREALFSDEDDPDDFIDEDPGEEEPDEFNDADGDYDDDSDEPWEE